MDTTYPVTPQSPDTLLIGGREHALFHGPFEPLKIVDTKYLWLNTAQVWFAALYTTLLVVILEPGSLLAAVGLLSAGAATLAVSVYTDNRSRVTVPVAVNEKHRSGSWSRLVISTRRNDPLTVTAHADMADFLLATVKDGPTPSFIKRPAIPADLRHPRTRMHTWIAGVGLAVASVALVALSIYVVAGLT